MWRVWFALGAALAVVGCDDPKDDPDPDTQPTVRSCVAGESVDIDGTSVQLAVDGLQIAAAAPNLTADGFQPLAVDTCGWTYGDNLFNVFHTGGADPASRWSEEHVVPSVRFTEGDAATVATDHLELAIQHVDLIEDLDSGNNTLFDVQEAGQLTYAFRVYGSDGNLADCVVWGHDVAALFAGGTPSDNLGNHSALSELNSGSCRVL